MSDTSAQTAAIWDEVGTRARWYANAFPELSSDPQTLMSLAQVPLDPTIAGQQAFALAGARQSAYKLQEVQGWNPSYQRGWWNSLTPDEQSAYSGMGYAPPKVTKRPPGLGIVRSLGSPATAAYEGIYRVGSKVIGTTLNGLQQVAEIPLEMYGNVRSDDAADQWIALAGAIGAAALIYYTGGTGASALAGLAGSGAAAEAVAGGVGITGYAVGGITGAYATKQLQDVVQGEWQGWANMGIHPWSNSMERNFTDGALNDAAGILGSSGQGALLNFAAALAYDADSDQSTVGGILAQFGGQRFDDDEQGVLIKTLEDMLRKRGYDQGPEWQDKFAVGMALIKDPKFREAIDHLRLHKISPGRDLARLVGLNLDSTPGRLLSGSADAAAWFVTDPTLAAGKLIGAERLIRYGVALEGETGQLATRIGALGERKSVQTAWSTMADHAQEGRWVELGNLMPNTRSMQPAMKRYAESMRARDHAWTWTQDEVRQFFSTGAAWSDLAKGRGGAHAVGFIQMPHLSSPGLAALRVRADIMDGLRAWDDWNLIVNLPAGVVGDEYYAAGRLQRYRAVRQVADEAIASGNDEFFNGIITLQRQGTANILHKIQGKVAALPVSMLTRVPTHGFIPLTNAGVEGAALAHQVTAFTETMRQLGMPSMVRRAWADALLDGSEASRRFAVKSFYSLSFDAAGVTATPEGQQLAQKFMEHLDQTYSLGRSTATMSSDVSDMMAIPDFREMRKASLNQAVLGKVLNVVDAPIIEAFQDKIWKPSILLRIGFATRAVGDELLGFLAREGMYGIAASSLGRSIGSIEAGEKTMFGHLSWFEDTWNAIRQAPYDKRMTLTRFGSGRDLIPLQYMADDHVSLNLMHRWSQWWQRLYTQGLASQLPEAVRSAPGYAKLNRWLGRAHTMRSLMWSGLPRDYLAAGRLWWGEPMVRSSIMRELTSGGISGATRAIQDAAGVAAIPNIDLEPNLVRSRSRFTEIKPGTDEYVGRGVHVQRQGRFTMRNEPGIDAVAHDLAGIMRNEYLDQIQHLARGQDPIEWLDQLDALVGRIPESMRPALRAYLAYADPSTLRTVLHDQRGVHEVIVEAARHDDFTDAEQLIAHIEAAQAKTVQAERMSDGTYRGLRLGSVGDNEKAQKQQDEAFDHLKAALRHVAPVAEADKPELRHWLLASGTFGFRPRELETGDLTQRIAATWLKAISEDPEALEQVRRLEVLSTRTASGQRIARPLKEGESALHAPVITDAQFERLRRSIPAEIDNLPVRAEVKQILHKVVDNLGNYPAAHRRVVDGVPYVVLTEFSHRDMALSGEVADAVRMLTPGPASSVPRTAQMIVPHDYIALRGQGEGAKVLSTDATSWHRLDPDLGYGSVLADPTAGTVTVHHTGREPETLVGISFEQALEEASRNWALAFKERFFSPAHPADPEAEAVISSLVDGLRQGPGTRFELDGLPVQIMAHDGQSPVVVAHEGQDGLRIAVNSDDIRADFDGERRYVNGHVTFDGPGQPREPMPTEVKRGVVVSPRWDEPGPPPPPDPVSKWVSTQVKRLQEGKPVTRVDETLGTIAARLDDYSHEELDVVAEVMGWGSQDLYALEELLAGGAVPLTEFSSNARTTADHIIQLRAGGSDPELAMAARALHENFTAFDSVVAARRQVEANPELYRAAAQQRAERHADFVVDPARLADTGSSLARNPAKADAGRIQLHDGQWLDATVTEDGSYLAKGAGGNKIYTGPDVRVFQPRTPLEDAGVEFDRTKPGLGHEVWVEPFELDNGDANAALRDLLEASANGARIVINDNGDLLGVRQLSSWFETYGLDHEIAASGTVPLTHIPARSDASVIRVEDIPVISRPGTTRTGVQGRNATLLGVSYLSGGEPIIEMFDESIAQSMERAARRIEEQVGSNHELLVRPGGEDIVADFIAQKGVDPTTFYAWMNDHPDLRQQLVLEHERGHHALGHTHQSTPGFQTLAYNEKERQANEYAYWRLGLPFGDNAAHVAGTKPDPVANLIGLGLDLAGYRPAAVAAHFDNVDDYERFVTEFAARLARGDEPKAVALAMAGAYDLPAETTWWEYGRQQFHQEGGYTDPALSWADFSAGVGGPPPAPPGGGGGGLPAFVPSDGSRPLWEMMGPQAVERRTGAHYADNRVMERVAAEDMPTRVLRPLMRSEYQAGGWDQIVRFGFGRVIGPLIDAGVRTPMAFHAFATAYQDIQRTQRWLRDPYFFGQALNQAEKVYTWDHAWARRPDDYERLLMRHLTNPGTSDPVARGLLGLSGGRPWFDGPEAPAEWLVRERDKVLTLLPEGNPARPLVEAIQPVLTQTERTSTEQGTLRKLAHKKLTEGMGVPWRTIDAKLRVEAEVAMQYLGYLQPGMRGDQVYADLTRNRSVLFDEIALTLADPNLSPGLQTAMTSLNTVLHQATVTRSGDVEHAMEEGLAAWGQVEEKMGFLSRALDSPDPEEVKSAAFALRGALPWSGLTVGDLKTMRAAWQSEANTTRHIKDIAMERAVLDSVPYVDRDNVRTQFSQQARNLFPFWHAEDQFLRRWARTVWHSPEFVRKAQLTYMGLKSAGFVQSDGFGNDYFVYPGTTVLAEVVGKLPFFDDKVPLATALTGQVKYSLPGLDRFGVPQASPLIAIPLSQLVAILPELQPYQEALVGQRGARLNLARQILPTQFFRFYDVATANDQATASSIMQATAVLEANGHGLPDDATPEQVSQYVGRLRNHARSLLLAKALFGFIAPAAPQTEIVGQTGHPGAAGGALDYRALLGVSTPEAVLNPQYMQLVRNLGAEEGTRQFLQLYPDSTPGDLFVVDGVDVNNKNIAYRVGQSKTLAGAPIASTNQAWAFYRDNQDWMEQNPMAGAWLLPSSSTRDTADARSSTVHLDMMAAGLRAKRSPDEFVRSVEFAAGSTLYFDAMDQFEAVLDQATKPEVRAHINAARTVWQQSYLKAHPVFAQELQSGEGRTRRQQVLAALRTAKVDPAAPLTEQGHRILDLVTAFDTYTAVMARLSTDSSRLGLEKRRQLKAAFADWGTSITRQYPDVTAFWSGVILPEAKV